MFIFTREERKVILFLAALFLFGLAISFMVKTFGPIQKLFYSSDRLSLININKADKELLMCVPGIGEKLSRKIIEQREASGGFMSVEELRGIKGITDSKFLKIRDYLSVGDE